MIIKLEKINNTQIGNSDGKEVVGTKLDGEQWARSFFANNDKLQNELGNFGIGEMVNVQLTQKGKFWNITGFSAPSDDDIANEKAKIEERGGNPTRRPAQAAGGSTSTSKKADGMSKAEWAEKNRVDALAIARAVALKAAVESLKEGSAAKAILKRADELLPFLTGDTGDPLAPPKK